MQEAKITTIFHGSEKSGTESYKSKVYPNSKGEIYIEIESERGTGWICFDIPTAIKFSKELRKGISELKDFENGESTVV